MTLFVLTDLKSGRVVWDNEKNIAKAIDQSQIVRFSKLGAGTCDGGEKEAKAALDSSDHERAQEIFHQACKLGNKQACENRNRVKKEAKRRAKIERREERKWEREQKREERKWLDTIMVTAGIVYLIKRLTVLA